MGKINQLTQDNFNIGKSFKRGNTKIISEENGTVKLYLHDNLIAFKTFRGCYITNAGYQTNVTKDRLNAILSMYGLKIKQKNFTWNIKGKLFDFTKTINIETILKYTKDV